jgi:hypothetical protein
VEDRSGGLWVPWHPYKVAVEVCEVDGCADRSHVHATERGDLEIWLACNGCAPRKAVHGCLCEQCHLRIQGWLGVGAGGLAWAYDWIAPDLQPNQSAAPSGKISRGKPAPPAAMNLHAHALRSDITYYLGGWLAIVTGEFNLVGPDWWSWRDEDHMYPYNQREVSSAAQYLVTWLDRAETVPGLIELMWDEAQDLIKRVKAIAPWEPQRTRLPNLLCPECEREAVTIATGDEHLVCRRCDAVIPRAKYDRWSFLISSEKEKVG